MKNQIGSVTIRDRSATAMQTLAYLKTLAVLQVEFVLAILYDKKHTKVNKTKIELQNSENLTVDIHQDIKINTHH